LAHHVSRAIHASGLQKALCAQAQLQIGNADVTKASNRAMIQWGMAQTHFGGRGVTSRQAPNIMTAGISDQL